MTLVLSTSNSFRTATLNTLIFLWQRNWVRSSIARPKKKKSLFCVEFHRYQCDEGSILARQSVRLSIKMGLRSAVNHKWWCTRLLHRLIIINTFLWDHIHFRTMLEFRRHLDTYSNRNFRTIIKILRHFNSSNSNCNFDPMYRLCYRQKMIAPNQQSQ